MGLLEEDRQRIYEEEKVEDAAELITLIARLPQRTVIPKVVIRPTMLRDPSKEIGVA